MSALTSELKAELALAASRIRAGVERWGYVRGEYANQGDTCRCALGLMLPDLPASQVHGEALKAKYPMLTDEWLNIDASSLNDFRSTRKCSRQLDIRDVPGDPRLQVAALFEWLSQAEEPTDG